MPHPVALIRAGRKKLGDDYACDRPPAIFATSAVLHRRIERLPARQQVLQRGAEARAVALPSGTVDGRCRTRLGWCLRARPLEARQRRGYVGLATGRKIGFTPWHDVGLATRRQIRLAPGLHHGLAADCEFGFASGDHRDRLLLVLLLVDLGLGRGLH